MNVSAVTNSGQTGPSLTVYGYAGDGALDESDPQRIDVLLGQTANAIDLGPMDIELDTTSLRALLESSGVLGLVLRANTADHLVSFDSLEQVGGEPMELTVEYSLAPGDFNGDGFVDSVDLGQWKSNFGSLSADFPQGDADGDSDVDGADFLVWQRGHSASASAPAMNAPEAATRQILLAAAVGAAVWRRFLVGFASS
jgi:hypothetical protein